MIVGFLCECGNIVITVAKLATNGRYFRPAYCPDCVRRAPLKELLVEEIALDQGKRKEG